MNQSQLVDRAAVDADGTSERVTLPDFGSKARTARKACTGRSTPRLTTVEIAATKGEKFTAGAGFKSAVN